jgi:adenylate cyclase
VTGAFALGPCFNGGVGRGEARSPEEKWRKVLVEGHRPLRMVRAVFGRIPSPPRCKMCSNPFGGIGGRLFRMAGHGPSRKNPNLCGACCDELPPGGAEVDIAVLFADVRGSTALGEHRDPAEFAALMNRFYKAATAVLVDHDALIDKLIGDEVMALFIPGVCGPDYRRRSIEAAVDLLRAVGYGSEAGPWLDLGIGVNAGVAYVGNVGTAVVDFTALGDPVNVAARLQALAAPGEMIVCDSVDEGATELLSRVERRTVELKGHTEPVVVLAHSP